MGAQGSGEPTSLHTPPSALRGSLANVQRKADKGYLINRWAAASYNPSQLQSLLLHARWPEGTLARHVARCMKYHVGCFIHVHSDLEPCTARNAVSDSRCLKSV